MRLGDPGTPGSRTTRVNMWALGLTPRNTSAKLMSEPIPPSDQSSSYSQSHTRLYHHMCHTTAKFVSNNFRRKASVSEMLHNLGWQSLDGRRQDQRLVLFYKIINGLA